MQQVDDVIPRPWHLLQLEEVCVRTSLGVVQANETDDVTISLQ